MQLRKRPLLARYRRHAIILAAGLIVSACAANPVAYQPAFHPEQRKGPPGAAPNAVLVLGTMHLSGLPDSFTPDLLAPLLDRLAAWRPTGIATEDMSGLQCDALRRYPARYAETVETYCYDPSAAAAATGLDVPTANTQAEQLLASWPDAPSAAQRRHLAALFMAAGERGSALVQWLRLDSAERHEGDGLDGALVAGLNRYANQRGETSQLSAVLAARLGLERLYSVDDHSADTPGSGDAAEQAAEGAAIAKAWDNPATRARQADDARLQAGIGEPGGLLAMYRAYNGPGAADRVYRSDFGAALTEPSPQQFGRHYVGYWETRNLRMVANIRDVLGQHPGMRLLAIVGASHKGYYEAYLHQMHDVQLVDSAAVLD